MLHTALHPLRSSLFIGNPTHALIKELFSFYSKLASDYPIRIITHYHYDFKNNLYEHVPL